MPHPAFIICSQKGAVDKISQSLNCFDVVASLPLHRLDDQEIPLALLHKGFTARIIAAWIREEGDEVNGRYEAEFVALHPAAAGETVISKFDEFAWPTPVHILMVPEFTVKIWPGPGIFTIEARLRKIGDVDWVGRQRCSFFLEEKQTFKELVAEQDKKPAIESNGKAPLPATMPP